MKELQAQPLLKFHCIRHSVNELTYTHAFTPFQELQSQHLQKVLEPMTQWL